MALVTLGEILADAEGRGYGVGAFNAFNLETAQAVVRAAEVERSPVILLVYDLHQEHFGVEESALVCCSLARKAKVPVAVHLDHGQSFRRVVECIHSGYTGVMFDGSRLSYEENIAITKRIVELAHIVGVTVEAELGHVGQAAEGDEKRSDLMTNPEEAGEFVERTGVDALAVAIGNAHGYYREEPKLDFERLAAIRKATGIPLVLHGGTGIPDGDMQRAISLGIRKINIGTEVYTAFGNALRSALQATTGPVISIDELAKARLVMQEKVQGRMRILGSSGKA